MSNSLAYDIYNEGGLLNGKYQKLENISEGAYGYVSLAKDIAKGRLVAVKYIYPIPDQEPSRETERGQTTGRSKSMINYSTREVVCEEAKHEIRIHEQLGTHPNIISCLDYFDSFIILEYCSRGDLYEAIQANTGPQTTRDIINVSLQLIDAVDYAHKRSIFHRDIKPENILITTDGTIRLSDWGLATTERYCNDFVVGSERYMAPELFDEGNIETYDASKCDVWSIGIVLLNIVFRKNPFNVANQTDKSFAYFACNREALFDIFSSMSNDLFTALRHCLTLDPNNRNLDELKEELLKVQSLTIDDDIEIWTKEEQERQERLAREAEEKLKAAQRTIKPISVNPISPKPPVIKVSYVNNNSHYVRRNHYDPLNRRHSPFPRAEPHNQSAHVNRHNPVSPSRFIPIKRNNNHVNDKSFAVHTPDTHINNHFQNFRKDMFNRTDYFTPPSVSAHYMEKFDHERRRNQQGASNSTERRNSLSGGNNLSASYGNGGGGGGSSHGSSGKYLPPFKQRLSHSKPTTSTSNQIISPSSSYTHASNATTARNSLSTIQQRKGSSFNSGKYIPPNLRVKYHEEQHHHYEAIISDNEDDVPEIESDDEMFFLDDTALRSSINRLQITKSKDEDSLDCDDALTTPSTSSSSQSKPSSQNLKISKPATVDLNTNKSIEKAVYVPPHHRGNFNQMLTKDSFRKFEYNKKPKRRHSTNTHSQPQSHFTSSSKFKRLTQGMDTNNAVVFEENEEDDDQYEVYDQRQIDMVSEDSTSSTDGEIVSEVNETGKHATGGTVKAITKVLNYA